MWTGLLSGTFPRWAPTPSESGSTFPSETVQYAEAGTLTHECPAVGPGRPPPQGPRPSPGAHTHLQHELTLISPHKDELSGEPVASAAAAHQEPGGGAHLGTGEACPALGGEGSSEQGSPAWARAPGHPKDQHRSIFLSLLLIHFFLKNLEQISKSLIVRRRFSKGFIQ